MNTRTIRLATLLAATSGACSADVFDVNVALAPHSYQMDFGSATGTIPTVTCATGAPSVCDTQQRAAVVGTTPGPSNISVDIGCDAATNRCFAEATARLTYTLDVLQDNDFATKVERHSAWIVHTVDLAYTVPTNTLTFGIPRIDVYVGPPGTTTENDTGVALVDRTTPIAPGTTFIDTPQHLTVAAGSPARDLIVSSIESKRSIVFVVVVTPRLEAGSPVPAGGLELDIYPSLGLGF
jgi:hypothetical protein